LAFLKSLSGTAENGERRASVETCGLVCSQQIDIVIAGDLIRAVKFIGGCNGNLQGIGSLVAGKMASYSSRFF